MIVFSCVDLFIYSHILLYLSCVCVYVRVCVRACVRVFNFFNQRAKRQNITVGMSFGATRELAFLHANNGTRAYFPQCNGMAFR